MSKGLKGFWKAYREGRQAAAERVRRVIAERWDEIYRDPDSQVEGNPKGDVTLTLFFDYHCVFCRTLCPRVSKMAEEDSGLRIFLKEFPPGTGSLVGSRAALASRAQGKYLAFHKALLSSGGRLDEEKVMKIAASVGLDTDRLKEDMEAPEITAIIERNRTLARALGIRSNPALAVGSELRVGSTSSKALRRLIERARS